MQKQATLYRMDMASHTCPFGLRSKDLLERNGYQVEDIRLTNRAQVDKVKAEFDVKTTPQTIIEGERIGGFDDLREHFGGAPASQNGKTYKPVAALFALSFLGSLAFNFQSLALVSITALINDFIALSMIFLGLLKLQDLDAFINSFLGYDLLAKRHVRYASVYPFAEAGAGVLMLSSLTSLIAIPIMIFIGFVGAISVIKAVYIDKRDLKCACVGGNANVPLGFVSLLENLMMLFGGFWMIYLLV